MLRPFSLILVFGVALVMTGCRTDHGSGPAVLFEAYMRDIAARNVETVMAHFTDDMEAEFSPEYVISREEMRHVLGFDFAVNAHVDYTVIAESDDSIEVAMVENNDLLTLLGVHDMRVRLRVVFRDGLIIRQIMLDLSFTGPSIDEAMAPFLAWAREREPEQFALINGETGPIYNAESAPVWLALARQWKDSIATP